MFENKIRERSHDETRAGRREETRVRDVSHSEQRWHRSLPVMIGI